MFLFFLSVPRLGGGCYRRGLENLQRSRVHPSLGPGDLVPNVAGQGPAQVPLVMQRAVRAIRTMTRVLPKKDALRAWIPGLECHFDGGNARTGR